MDQFDELRKNAVTRRDRAMAAARDEYNETIARNASTEYGDSWTFLAIDADTKLILTHQVGQRDQNTCWSFLLKLKAAITGDKF